MRTNKGIVIEANQKHAIILLPGGEYRKVRTGGKYLEPGDLYEQNATLLVKYAVAAVLVLTILVGGIDYHSVKAYARLGSDLEMGINRWGRVVTVEAKSEAARQILNAVEIENDKMEVAVEKIIRQAILDEKTSPQDVRRNLSVTAKEKEKQNPELEKKLQRAMEKGLEKAQPKANPGVDKKDQPKSEVKANPSVNKKTEPKAEVKANPSENKKTEPKAEVKANPSVNKKTEPKAEVKASPSENKKANPKAKATQVGDGS